MLISKAARRYSFALLGVSVEANTLEQTLKDIQYIQSVLKNSKDLSVFLKSPVVNSSDKKAVLEKVFFSEIGKETQNFLTLLSNKGREVLLEDALKAFTDEYNKHSGIIDVEVKSAKILDKAQIEALQKALEKSTSKKVNLDLIVQEDLRGGMSVKIGDTVIDGTIKHKLNQLETLFLDSSVE